MASGKLPSVCLLCQQIFNEVFSFSNTGRTLLIRSSIALIIFSLPLGRILKGIWCLKNFQKNFYFYALSTMALFFLAAMSEKDILKENSVSVIKRNIHNL